MAVNEIALRNQLLLFDAAVGAASNGRRQEHIAIICNESLGLALFERAIASLTEIEQSEAYIKTYPPNSLRMRAVRFFSNSYLWHGLRETKSFIEVQPVTKLFMELPTGIGQMSLFMEEAKRIKAPGGQLILLNASLLSYIKKEHPSHAQDALLS